MVSKLGPKGYWSSALFERPKSFADPAAAICSSRPRSRSAPARAPGSTRLKPVRQRLRLSPCAPVQLKITLGCPSSGRTWSPGEPGTLSSFDEFDPRSRHGENEVGCRAPSCFPARGWQPAFERVDRGVATKAYKTRLRKATKRSALIGEAEMGAYPPPDLLCAGGRHNSVHAQILHHLAIMIKPMRDAEGRQRGPCLKAWFRRFDHLKRIARRQRLDCLVRKRE